MDKKRILVIDDEPSVRQALAEFLMECGYEPITAPGGAEGLTLALAGEFHVVLVDLMMPYVDGLEVIATLKDRRSELPVVVVSGTGVLGDAVEAMRRGAWDYISKPIHDIDMITVVIERVMERARLIAERSWAESQRDAALAELQKAHAELETRLDERTVELARTNEALRIEIVERKRAEAIVQNRLDSLIRPTSEMPDLSFTDLFDLDEIQEIQDSFAQASGVASIITDTDGRPITKPSNFCRLCRDVIRQTEKGLSNCFHSDAVIGRHNPQGPIMQPCLSGGLWDGGASISVGDRHVANWLVGQVRNDALNEEEMVKYAQEIGVDEEEFRAALAEVTVMPVEQFELVCQVLFLVANQMSKTAFQNAQQARFIYKLRQAEAAIRESEERFRLVAKSTSDLIYEWNVSDDQLLWFGDIDVALGFGAGEFPRTLEAWMRRIHPDDQERLADSAERHRTSTQHMYEEYRIRREDGTWRHWIDRGVPVLDSEGRPSRWIGACIDVTERKQAEEELRVYRDHLEELVEERTTELTRMVTETQLLNEELEKTKEAALEAQRVAEVANRAKSEFLSNMSHEIRTPLNGVLGYAQILKRDRNLTPSQGAGLEVIERSGNHLLTLIDDILDLSKIEAQKMEISESGFLLGDSLNSIAAIIHVRARQKGVEFHFEASPELPAAVYGDEKRLSQVLINLLGNAVKFTDDGSVVLEVQAVEDKIRFQVEDTGIGIPNDKLEDVFSPFEQVARHTRTIEGTGLGLAISRSLVQLMGGALHVESRMGQGSIFWFDLTLPQVSEWIETERSEERYIVGFKGKPRKVLVVDDKEDNRAVLVNLLLPLGFEVIEAVNGREGLDKTFEFLPDLVLMDLVMPVMDGFDATRQIKNSPQLAHVKVIAVSASSSLGSHEISAKIGCDDYVQKPVQVQELFDKMGMHLELEWIYEESVVPVETGPLTLAGIEAGQDFVVPPSSEIRELYELAECGDFAGLKEQLDRVDQMDESYAPFVAALRELASTFRWDEVCELIEKYKEEGA